MHWTNAVAMLVMITSGWGIYDDDVIIRGLTFSGYLRLVDWAAWSLNWHFAGMWLFAINGLFYLVYGVLTGRLRERLLQIRVKSLPNLRCCLTHPAPISGRWRSARLSKADETAPTAPLET